MTGSKKTTGGKPISTPMESYAINLVLPKLQNGTKWNVNSLQLEIMIFALILGLLRGMLGRSFLLELPPRARRIRVLDSDPGTGYGTTSACAENTTDDTETINMHGNYLRVRGEYHGRHGNHQHAWELPPRARRIHGRQGFTRIKHGTTSACAENTKSERMSDAPPRNYLRVRGEYSGIRQWACTQAELPPRARRILGDKAMGLHPGGTTSACAENTVTIRVEGFQHGNYLRVRGEYGHHQGRGLPAWELPPRARRIHVRGCCFVCVMGTTSACAENTS